MPARLGQTRLPPLELLAAINAIENDMGRQNSVRWGPRLIDVDILFHGEAAFEHAQLSLPHKDLFERAFVLVPLAEIAPGLMIPAVPSPRPPRDLRMSLSKYGRKRMNLTWPARRAAQQTGEEGGGENEARQGKQE